MLVGKHKGFIDGKDWINTQTIINMNKQMNYRKPQKNTALLTGIIMCKKCGSPMRPRLCNNRFDENGDVKYVYSCTLKEKSRGHKCKGKNINGNKVDKLLIQEIKKLIAPNEKICNELKKIINTKTSIVNENEEFIYLKAKYDKNQKYLDDLIQKIKYIDISLIDEINKEVVKIKKENEKLEEKLNSFNQEKENTKLDIDAAKMVLDIMEKHFEQFDTMDIVEKKALLRLIINSAVGNGDTVEINLLTDDASAFFNTNLSPACEYRK